jgi:GDPmannose 4,6-dehydratase
MVKAIIMGVDGQDGSYLADLLLSKGYDVVGWVPDLDQVSYENIQHNLSDMTIVKGDYINQESFVDLLDCHKPDELYKLASPSFPS